MTDTLLAQFVHEECTPHVRTLLLEAISVLMAGASPGVRRFELNRFELTMDGETRTALIEDVLEPSESGQERVAFAQLLAALQAGAG